MFRSPQADYPGIVEKDACLQTAIIIDDMSEENGPIQFVLGSHQLGDLKLVSEDYVALRGFSPIAETAAFAHLLVKKLTAQSGDVVIWSSLSEHGSERNPSKSPRAYYMNGFAKAECSRPWPDYLKNGKLQALDFRSIP